MGFHIHQPSLHQLNYIEIRRWLAQTVDRQDEGINSGADMHFDKGYADDIDILTTTMANMKQNC